jgi:radical SAM protein with 4Fe4S-binding SPASM domain
MTNEEAMSVVRQLGEAGTWHLSLTGGETLLRKDLPEIIKEAKKYNMFVNVNTNGALLAKKAKRLVDAGLDSLIISLDSHIPETHDEAREIPKLTESIFRGIEAVRKAQKGGKKPEIVLRMIISKQNYQDIDTYIDKFAHLVDKIAIQPIHDGVTAPKFKINDKLNLFHIKETDIYQFTRADQPNYKKTFDDLYKKYTWLDKKFIREFETFIFDKDGMWEKYKCYAGYYYMVVDPALDTFPCTFFVDKLDSLRDHSLMDIWRSDKIKKWRTLVKNKQNTCTCACGIAEVNVTLSNKLESKIFHPFSDPKKIDIKVIAE